MNSSSTSSWWKDLIGISRNCREDAIEKNYSFDIGRGYITSFWYARWLNEVILKDCFPMLFSISKLQSVSFACMGGWDRGEWTLEDFGVLRATMIQPQVMLDL